MKNLLKRIASVATELDYAGLTKEAKALDNIMLKLANENSNEKKRFEEHYKGLFDQIFKMIISKVELLETERYKFFREPYQTYPIQNFLRSKGMHLYKDPDGDFWVSWPKALQNRFRHLLSYVAFPEFGEIGDKLNKFVDVCNEFIAFCKSEIQMRQDSLRMGNTKDEVREIFRLEIPLIEYIIYYVNKMIELGRDLVENKPTQIDPWADSEKYLANKNFYEERKSRQYPQDTWFEKYNPGFDPRTGPRQIKEPNFRTYFEPLNKDQEEENLY
jgi:hypothetical protein